MVDFTLGQGDTKTFNYTLPFLNVSPTNVIVNISNMFSINYSLTCISQLNSDTNYVSPDDGGVSFTLTENESKVSGLFFVQFIYTDNFGKQHTYPDNRYLTMRILKSIAVIT